MPLLLRLVGLVVQRLFPETHETGNRNHFISSLLLRFSEGDLEHVSHRLNSFHAALPPPTFVERLATYANGPSAPSYPPCHFWVYEREGITCYDLLLHKITKHYHDLDISFDRLTVLFGHSVALDIVRTEQGQNNAAS